MTKQQVEQKIKEILSKDKRFFDTNIEIKFNDREVEETINKSIDSLKSLLNHK